MHQAVRLGAVHSERMQKLAVLVEGEVENDVNYPTT